MFTPEEVQNLRQKSGDSAVFNQLLSDPEFKAKVDRVQQANPNMSDFEKMKFPSAMIDIHYKAKPRTTMDQTATILNTAMAQQKKGALATLTEDPLVFAGQTLKNVPRSMGQLVGGVYSAVTNPIQTGKTLFKLGVGGTANSLESIAGLAGVRNPEQIFDLESEDVAKAVGDFYVQRYGSVEAAANTLREDPAGFLSDLGAVVTGVGGAIKGGATAVGALSGAATKSSTVLTGLGRGVRAAQALGGSMVKTGINMEPLVIAGKGIVMAGRGTRNLTRAAAVGMIPDNMVTKSLKVNPSDISSFKNLPGSESMGSFLMRKGVLSGGAAEVGDQGITLAGSLPVGRTRVGIIDDLGKIFNKALETVDNELSGVRQTYDILDDVPADIPKLLDQIYTVAKKYDLKEQVQFIETLLKKERVSLSELNQLKRTAYDLFRTYKTSNVPADSFAARQINQYERVLRKFIEDQAQSKGLPDIGALNDDIMKSREILDAIEKADAASLSKGKLTFGLYDGMFGIGAYGLTGDFMTTAGIVMGRKVLESTIFKTTFAKYLNRLDPRNIEILDKAFKTMRHTKESKSILRKVVAQTADDIKNKRIGEEEASRAIPDQSLMQQARVTMPEQQVAGSYTDNVSDISKAVNAEDNLPLSSFSPQGVRDAAKMDELVKGGMTPKQAAKSLNDFPDMTPDEIVRLTPEEKATGLIGGSDTLAPLMKEARKYKTGSDFVEWLRKSVDTSTGNKTKDMADFIAGKVTKAEKTRLDFIKTLEQNSKGGWADAAFDLWKQANQIVKLSDDLGGKGDNVAYIATHKGAISPASPSLPKPLGGSDTIAPLMKEARKYKSQYEFVAALRRMKPSETSPELQKAIKDLGVGGNLKTKLEDLWRQSTGNIPAPINVNELSQMAKANMDITNKMLKEGKTIQEVNSYFDDIPF